MNFRERVIKTVQFQEVDEIPIEHKFGLMPGVLEDWSREGLPSWVKTQEDIYTYFGFENIGRRLPININVYPPFESKIIQENDVYRISIDYIGRTTKLMKGRSTTGLAIELPIKDWDTWKEYKKRLFFFPERIGENLEEVVEYNLQNGYMNNFDAKGFFWFPRELMGDEKLLMAYYDDPELIHDITETWCLLLEEVLTAVLERVKIDRINLGEDMAYKTASMISKSCFNEFIKPYYQRIYKLVERYHVPIFSTDTDGCTHELIHWFAECGVNLIGPNEVQAGNDITLYRKALGKIMAFDGGLDKLLLLQGKSAIDEMLRRIVPYMKETGGGWIASLDHRVVKGTTLTDFQYYVNELRDMAKF
jgi:hypothetical protein